jgi:hypothetical protein
MSAPLIIATILVAGWNITLTLTAYLTETGPFRPAAPNGREMTRARMHVDAEIGTPDLDARTDAWRRSGSAGPTEHVESRVTDTSQEVTVPAPYAETSVTVAGRDGEEARRCSLCLN